MKKVGKFCRYRTGVVGSRGANKPFVKTWTAQLRIGTMYFTYSESSGTVDFYNFEFHCSDTNVCRGINLTGF